MAENQSKFQIDLPPENWLDIFACFPRRPNLSDKLSLVCRQFWHISHILLHEKGKISLGKLYFDSEKFAPASNNEKRAILWAANRKVPFPEVEMPENIVDFEEIVISHLNDQAFQMLKKMSDHLFSGLNLWLDFDDDDIAGQALTKALAMLGQILARFDSKISIKSIQLPCADAVQCLAENFPQIWSKLEFLYFEEFIKIDDKLVANLCEWLNKRDDENESSLAARILTATIPERNAQMLIEHNVREFHKSAQAAAYFARLTIMGHQLENFTARRELNEKTGEILTLEINWSAKNWSGNLCICRHKIEADAEWIAAKMREMNGWRWGQKRKMVFRVE